MNTLNLYPFCEALTSGLLHSLWLFPLLAGLDWLLTRALPQSRHRYLSHLLTLLTCLVAFAAIVGRRWWSVTDRYWQATYLEAELGAPLTVQLTDGFAKLGLTEAADWMVWLAGAYALGLLGMLARCGYRYLASVRMRRGGLLPEPEHRSLFARLRGEIVPGRRVDWRITTRVRNVLVVGVLRPVILFPVGLVNQLTTEEVTAVLRHELTHLRRYDPFWNAVQEVIQALFFYHPVIYWLGRELDREREFACDDAVLRGTEPKTYARALLRVANYSLHPKTPFTMAATSSPDFTQRIQRLFAGSAPRPALSLAGRSYWFTPLALLSLVLVLAYTVLNPTQLNAQSSTTEVTISGTILSGDTGRPLIGATVVVPGTETGTITDLDGEYELRIPTGSTPLSLSYVGYKSLDIQFRATKSTTMNFTMYAGKQAEIVAPETNVLLLDRRTGDAEEASPEPSIRLSGDGFVGRNVLIVVDGVPRDPEDNTLEDINPDDIESINVYKGEKMKALGYDAKWEGVIMIKTKQ